MRSPTLTPVPSNSPTILYNMSQQGVRILNNFFTDKNKNSNYYLFLNFAILGTFAATLNFPILQ